MKRSSSGNGGAIGGVFPGGRVAWLGIAASACFIACGPSAAHLAAARHEIANYYERCDDEQIVLVETTGDDANSTIVSRGCGATSDRFRCTQKVAPFSTPGPVRCERMQRHGSDWVVDVNPVPQPMAPPPGWTEEPKKSAAPSPPPLR